MQKRPKALYDRRKKDSDIFPSESFHYSLLSFTIDKRMKVLLDNWGFVPVGRARTSKEASAPDPEMTSHPKAEVIDGDRDSLPG